MKMVRAILRPQTADTIADTLAGAGYSGMTKVSAFGRGKQQGLHVGPVHYDELPKTILMIVAEDPDVDTIVDTIIDGARTGSYGDGKVFVTDVDEAYTIRTGHPGL